MPETGTLKIQIYTGSRAFPVAGACVSVLGRNADGSRTLEAFRRTGPDGSAGPIAFEAPDESVSLDESSQAQAYRAVDVLVDSPGFYSSFIEGVQIFAGQNSRQEAELIPLPESVQAAGTGGSVSYYIPPQNL